MQVIYLDMLWLLNLVMDYIAFFIALKISGQKYRHGGIFIASCLAATLYCIATLTPFLQTMPMWFLQIFIPIISVLYLFKPNTLSLFLKNLILVHVIAWGMGGLIFNILYMLGSRYSKGTVFFIIGGGGIALCLILGSLSLIRRRILSTHFEYEVRFYLSEQQIQLKGYLDTGNQLYTVGSAKPVIVVAYDAIKENLTKEIWELIECYKQQGEAALIQKLSYIEKDIDYKIYLVPFQSVGCKEGLLIGIEVSQLMFNRGRWSKTQPEGVIALSLESLFCGGCYDVLIHPEYIQ